jgi:hypothetical protein
LSYLLQDKYSRPYTITEIKKDLWKAYEPYMKEYNIKIVALLKSQGKIEMMNRIKKSLITFETLIMSEEYYITNLDLWMLASSKKLPIVLFCEKNFKTMVTDVKWLVLGGENYQDKYYFIRSPMVIENNIPRGYSLIKTPLLIEEVKGLNTMIQSGINGVEEYKKSLISLDNYLRGL